MQAAKAANSLRADLLVSPAGRSRRCYQRNFSAPCLRAKVCPWPPPPRSIAAPSAKCPKTAASANGTAASARHSLTSASARMACTIACPAAKPATTKSQTNTAWAEAPYAATCQATEHLRGKTRKIVVIPRSAATRDLHFGTPETTHSSESHFGKILSIGKTYTNRANPLSPMEIYSCPPCLTLL